MYSYQKQSAKMSSVNNISLYIPRVFANISKERVKNVFEDLKIGKVSAIDFISKMCGQLKYNAAYIHFEYWCDNNVSRNFQERVLDASREARIVYDDPWFWIVLENKAKKHISADRKPCISLNLQEDTECAPPEKQQMTNKDFSDLFKTPIKKVANTKISDLIHLSTVPKLVRSTNDYRGYYNNHDNQYLEEIKADYSSKNDYRGYYNNHDIQYLEEIKADYSSKNDYCGYYNNHHNEDTIKDMEEIEAYLENNMEEGEIADDDSAIMDEIEALMEETEQQVNEHLIRIDGRYVQELERENVALRESVMRLQKLNAMLGSQIPNNASRSTAFA